MSGRHRKPTTSSISVAKIAFTGAVIGGGGIALAGHASAATDEQWDAVAGCESGGNWANQHRQRLPRRAAVLAGHLGRAWRRRVRRFREPGHPRTADRRRRAGAGHPGPRRLAGLRPWTRGRDAAQRPRRRARTGRTTTGRTTDARDAPDHLPPPPAELAAFDAPPPPPPLTPRRPRPAPAADPAPAPAAPIEMAAFDAPPPPPPPADPAPPADPHRPRRLRIEPAAFDAPPPPPPR